MFFSPPIPPMDSLLSTQVKLTQEVPEARETETPFTVEVKKKKSYICQFLGGAPDLDQRYVW